MVSSVVMVLSPSAGLPATALSDEHLGSILGQPLSLAQGPDGRALVSNVRKQIELHLLGNRVELRDLSGSIGKAISTIPTIINEIVAAADNPISSYGVNFIADLHRANAVRWLSDTFLNPDLSTRLDTPLSSNSTSIVIQRLPKVVTIRFSHGVSDRVNVNFNASEKTIIVPRPQILAQDMENQHSLLTELLERIVK